MSLYEVNTSFCFMRTDPADFHIPFHSHRCFELVYYFSGKGHCKVDGTLFEYEKGCYVLIPPDAPHNDEHTEKCHLLCVGFTLARDYSFLHKMVGTDNSRRIGSHLKIIDSELKDKQDDFVSVVNNCMSNVLTEIKRAGSPSTSRLISHQDLLTQAVHYIDEYFLSDITPEQLTEMTNYSYHRFRHIFKEALGLSPKQYILAKRLEHAKKLIATTQKTITEIGYLSGFPNTSLFIKQFREKTGITPNQYRHQFYSDHVFSEEQSNYKQKTSPETNHYRS